MKNFLTVRILLIFFISLFVCLGVFLIDCAVHASLIFHETQNVKNLSIESKVELLKGQKIEGNFHSSYSHLGIVSLRFTNFGKINTDVVVFRLKEKNTTHWIYENSYKVDQFQPDQFFTFGFPVQAKSNNKDYSFEIESLLGQKGDAVGISAYQPTLRLTYAFSRKDLLSHPKSVLEVMHFFIIQKISETKMRLLLLGLWIFTFSLLLMITSKKQPLHKLNSYKSTFVSIKKYIKKHSVFFIIFTGLFFRLLLATGSFGGDTNAFWHESLYPQQHIYNVYAHSNEHGYNYSPVIFFVFITLGALHNILHFLSWPFLWRAFLTLFDLGTVYVLMQLAKIRKINPVQTALIFFLNPISVLISGYHGQFENVAIFFVLLAALLQYKVQNKKNKKRFVKWLYLTIGLMVKHIIVYQLLVFWRAELKKKYQIILLFCLSVGVFLVSFVPFWFGAERLIIQNVFLYGGISGYGIANFLTQIISQMPVIGYNGAQIYKCIFLVFLFTLPLFLERKDVLRNMLFMFLFFLTFTPGIGIQYFIIPIAVGSLFPTKWFYLYSIAIGLIISILEKPLPILPMQFFPIDKTNLPWLVTAFWFFSELLFLSKPLQKFYNSLFSSFRTQ
ncbi:MAG TPA: hypothetical protein VLB73_03050 [Patescibacteria group bacterium]|nr:hypothetical protein [Patescibacteria group bacterium]